MKKIILIITAYFTMLSSGIGQCDLKLKDQMVTKSNSESYTFIKDFTFELKDQSSEMKYNILLNKNTSFRFYFGISDKYTSETEFEVYSTNTKESKKIKVSNGIDYLEIIPKETGVFDIIVKIVEGTRSCGVIILSSKKNDGKKFITSPSDKASLEDTTQFVIVDEMPEFIIGDADSFRKWITQNLKYPEFAKAKGIQGKTYLQFIVDKEGKMQNIKVIRSVDPEIDNYLVELFKTCPAWQKPGKQKGKAVNVLFTFPVNMVLDKNKK